MSSLRTSWRRQRLPLKKCLTRVLIFCWMKLVIWSRKNKTGRNDCGYVTGQAEETAMGQLHFFIIFINNTTHVPQTFVVAIKPDEFIRVDLSPLHFRSAWKSLLQALLKHVTQSYATIFHQQQSWTDLCCNATCTRTAMVYRGRADSPVHGRVRKLRMGEGEWASYYPFRSTTRLDSYSPVTWLFTRPNVYTGRVIHAFSCSPLYSTAYSTNVN